MKLLCGTRVIELVGPFGGSCGRFLASLGAEVVRVVAPSLSEAGIERPTDPYQRFEAHGKQTVNLDLDTREGIAQFRALITQADFLLESAPVGALAARRLDYASLSALAPRLIHASITAFGSDGPYAPYRGSELIASAMSGVLRQRGDRDRAPVKEPLDACIFHASASAAAALMLAHHERGRSGRGQHVDISLQQVGVSRNVGNLLRWQFERRRPARAGRAVWERRVCVRCIWTLADGYLYHRPTTGAFGATEQAWARWMEECSWSGLSPEVRWSAGDRGPVLAEKRDRWERTLDGFLQTRSKVELTREAGPRGIDATVVEEPEALLCDPQLLARSFFAPLALEPTGTLQVPARFVNVEEPPPQELSPFAETSARRPERARELRSGLHPLSWEVQRGGPRRGALAGVKVLELSSQLVGSLTARALGDHGAHVIKLDAMVGGAVGLDARRAASLRRSIDATAWFVHLNASKLSVCVDRAHARTREVFEPLLAWADVVIESYPPDAPELPELGFRALLSRRPDLVVVSASAYGKSGPRADRWEGDDVRAARSGRIAAGGWPDRAPVTPVSASYDDFVTSPFLVASIAAALAHRRRSGEGCHIDASMFEIGAQQMTEAMLLAQSGRPLTPTGNRSPRVLFQGVYPTRGDDRWIAITLWNARDWTRMSELMGGALPDVRTLAKADEATLDAIDRQLATFTSGFVDVQLMHMLQARGVAAGVLQDAEDLLERDPQLRARRMFIALEHPVLGAFAHQALPYQLDASPANMRTSPLLGQHTDFVCREMLGLEDAQIAALTAAGLLI